MNGDKMNETRPKKDKNQHIQVFVRVRPTNNAEKASKSATVLDVTSCKEVTVKERPQDKLTKKFTFDRVFGPGSKQVEVYNAVVSPLLDEVLAGYNCTVFAYGQTGTGKTFTMEGAGNDPALHWQSDTQAGIIPRSLSHLFDELRTLDAQEYSVRVSFLELYNEELFDLLSPTDDASKIRLYEDASRKGAVIIHGLEEVTVHNKSEVYKILEKGSEKRQTAATLMNAQSSRSHTVFSITVHIKENTVDGEELLKTGKLNLVDLAGSENVGRSGAVDRRAREAGNINQSLLTLGRVITALVERAPHIPYRESKLTRLLQESLGGRTKTSIIATVSPASVNLEETLSTLDYAHRAKNITNRPEINQKLSKKALLKEYTEEIERLRRDLLATRERNGVYLAQENYSEMQTTIEYQGKEIEEKINHIKALEEATLNKEKLFNDLQTELEIKTAALFETKDQLESTKNTLESTKECLQTTKFDRDVHKHLMEKHATTEKILYSQAQTLLKVADTATDDTYKLHDKIFRKKRVEEENENLGEQFRGNIDKRFGDIETDLSRYTQDLVQFCLSMKDQILAQVAVNSRGIDTTVQLSKDLVQDERALSEELEKNVNASYDDMKQWVDAQVCDASRMAEERTSDLRELSTNIASRMQQLCENRIAENLRVVQEQNAKKIETLLEYVKDSTNTFCETLLADRDRLSESIAEMRESIETTKRTQQQSQHSRKNFSEAFESLWNHFKSLSEEEETRGSLIMDSLSRAEQTCTDIGKQSEDSCNKHMKNERAFEKEIHSSVDDINSFVASNMKKNWELADETIQQRKVLVNDLEKGINDNCEAFATYKTLVENNARDIRSRTEADRNSIVSCTNVKTRKNRFGRERESRGAGRAAATQVRDGVRGDGPQIRESRRRVHRVEQPTDRATANDEAPSREVPRGGSATGPTDRLDSGEERLPVSAEIGRHLAPRENRQTVSRNEEESFRRVGGRGAGFHDNQHRIHDKETIRKPQSQTRLAGFRVENALHLDALQRVQIEVSRRQEQRHQKSRSREVRLSFGSAGDHETILRQQHSIRVRYVHQEQQQGKRHRGIREAREKDTHEIAFVENQNDGSSRAGKLQLISSRVSRAKRTKDNKNGGVHVHSH